MSKAVVIRKAQLRDVPKIMELAIESVSRNPVNLVIDKEEMECTIKAIIASPMHYGCVAEEGGVVVGALGAFTQKGFWFKRMQCCVLMFFATRPGTGAALIRDFTRWMMARSTIKMTIFSLEPGMDPRIGIWLRRLGYTHEFPSYAYIRGMQ